MLTARILVVLAAIFAVLSLIAGFVRWQGLDTDSVEETAELMIADAEIRDQMATTLVESIYANVDVAAALEERLPEAQQGFAPVVAGALEERLPEESRASRPSWPERCGSSRTGPLSACSSGRARRRCGCGRSP